MTVLLLLDSGVPQVQNIAAAARPDVSVVVYNRATESLADLRARIETAVPAGSGALTVGIVQEGSHYLREYRIVSGQAGGRVSGVQTADPSLATWQEMISFFSDLKTQRALATVDFISCSLLGNSGFAYVIAELEKRLDIDFRASSNRTGNLAHGDWIQESDNVDIRDLYFTDAINAYTSVLFRFPWRSKQGLVLWDDSKNGLVNPLQPAFDDYVETKNAGRVYTWGENAAGADISTVASELASGIIGLTSTNSAFAAVSTSGKVVTWGNPASGGDSSSVATDISAGIVKVFRSDSAFAALHSSGTMVSWGSIEGGGDSTDVSNQLVDISWCAIAALGFAAVKTNGAVVSWWFDGVGTQTVYRNDISAVAIATTVDAFAALTATGSVVVWGEAANGGDITGLENELSGGIIGLASTTQAFAALRNDGAIIVWGDMGAGGIFPSESRINTDSNWSKLTASLGAFAALDGSGMLFTWGAPSAGGTSPDISAGDTFINVVPMDVGFVAIGVTRDFCYGWTELTSSDRVDVSAGIQKVATNAEEAFLSLDNGQNVPVLSISTPTGGWSALPTLNRVATNYNSFGAIDISGSLYWWGDATFYNVTFASLSLTTEVQEIQATGGAYAVIALLPTEEGGGDGGGGGGGVPCFLAEAPILTPHGYVKISTLSVGDVVSVPGGKTAVVDRVLFHRVPAGPNSNPYVIPRGTFGAEKRVLISPRHRVAVPGRGMVEARHLGLEQRDLGAEEIEYWNVEVRGWQNMIVAGVEVESLAPFRRIVVTADQFRAMLKDTYGENVAQDKMRQIVRRCRFGPSGIEVPVLKKTT